MLSKESGPTASIEGNDGDGKLAPGTLIPNLWGKRWVTVDNHLPFHRWHSSRSLPLALQLGIRIMSTSMVTLLESVFDNSSGYPVNFRP